MQARNDEIPRSLGMTPVGDCPLHHDIDQSPGYVDHLARVAAGAASATLVWPSPFGDLAYLSCGDLLHAVHGRLPPRRTRATPGCGRCPSGLPENRRREYDFGCNLTRLNVDGFQLQRIAQSRKIRLYRFQLWIRGRMLESTDRLLLQPSESSCRGLAEIAPLTRSKQKKRNVDRGFRGGEIPPLLLIERRDIGVEIIVLNCLEMLD
jgi:hypothetical protein